jgi:hypothetical protein
MLFLTNLLGSEKAYWSWPKSCLGQVFNFKLDSFADMNELYGANAKPYLKLKLGPRFCPASLSLSTNQLGVQFLVSAGIVLVLINNLIVVYNNITK